MNPLPTLTRRLTPANLNIYFSAACFFSPAVLGSVVSFVFHGGALWSVVLLAAKRRRFNIDPPMLWITAATYIYCAAMVSGSLASGMLRADLPLLLPLATLLFFPISYSTWSITDKLTLARIAVRASAAACVGALALAIVQYYWIGMLRAEGGAGNPIVFATVTCLAAMMCLAGALSGLEEGRMPFVAAALAGVLAILYSGSRLIWVALLVAAVAVFLIYRKKLTRGNIRRSLTIAVASCLLTVAVTFPIVVDRTVVLFKDWDALVTKGDHSTPLGLRVGLWDIGVNAFRETPFIGHGVSASRALIKQGFKDRFGMDQGFNHFHNGFLTALVEAGLLGALALAAVFAIAACYAARVLRCSADPAERFGATMVTVTVVTYLIGGLGGILVGHDILDSTLMVFLVSGTYLACGETVSPIRKHSHSQSAHNHCSACQGTVAFGQAETPRQQS
ncbi:O-antigen ligase family protein [Mesorhizobium sp. M1A.F.Ca.IN.020.30.1.1]|nr:O-antigen ligase family protein [Mesorhizobium sp. M1A.F.Ca.IN.020.30.1.1]RWG43315.1 MAG: O-antigen ligase family protein [Mesorhizobium sp.]RWG75477.1 MAG: O-antigen ligase family protein [Mesorhizobium sp.]TIM76315.1 MAG: O-antigen ligase family protein [Mesorhizobium sp.]TIM93218.1 MAG: O-antigen ligase family protein [Mesorhizobium sp.]